MRLLSKSAQLIIKLYEKGYRADECGEIRSHRGVKLKTIIKLGYHTFSGDGILKVKVHRFVAYQKYGRRSLYRGVVVRHMDNNPLNNRPENLRLGTQLQNMRDKPKEVRQEQARKMLEGRRLKQSMKSASL